MVTGHLHNPEAEYHPLSDVHDIIESVRNPFQPESVKQVTLSLCLTN
jgi:hypothetical protein